MTRLALFLALMVSSCGPLLSQEQESTRCVPKATRCYRNTVELCSPQGHWMTVMTCKDVGTTWKCVDFGEGPSCVE